jgi:hypothetical protein
MMPAKTGIINKILTISQQDEAKERRPADSDDDEETLLIDRANVLNHV